MNEPEPLDDLTPEEDAWVWSRVIVTLLALAALAKLVEWLR